MTIPRIDSNLIFGLLREALPVGSRVHDNNAMDQVSFHFPRHGDYNFVAVTAGADGTYSMRFGNTLVGPRGYGGGRGNYEATGLAAEELADTFTATVERKRWD